MLAVQRSGFSRRLPAPIGGTCGRADSDFYTANRPDLARRQAVGYNHCWTAGLVILYNWQGCCKIRMP
jgi:hypothetical protein